MRWDDLRIFLAAHKAGSFSAAASVLRVEQSTVSRRIASLEAALGVAVFLRSRQGLVLTEHGERIMPLALEASARIEELATLSRTGGVEGTVRLALTESMAVYGLTAGLHELLLAHPALRLQLISSMNMSDLSRREADIALRLVRTQRGDLISKRVARLPNGLWGHPRWRGVAWEALEWVGLDTDAGLSTGRAWIQAHAVRPPRITTNGFVGMVEALRYGIGVGIVPDALAQQLPDLVQLASPAPPPPTPVYLVAHRASREVPQIAAVWSFLEAHMRRLATST
jgi:DNA-binding transcriptional LysR family regulator